MRVASAPPSRRTKLSTFTREQDGPMGGDVVLELRNKCRWERHLVGALRLHVTGRELQPPHSALLCKMYTKNHRGKVLEAQRPRRHERNHQPVAIVNSAS